MTMKTKPEKDAVDSDRRYGGNWISHGWSAFTGLFRGQDKSQDRFYYNPDEFQLNLDTGVLMANVRNLLHNSERISNKEKLRIISEFKDKAGVIKDAYCNGKFDYMVWMFKNASEKLEWTDLKRTTWFESDYRPDAVAVGA